MASTKTRLRIPEDVVLELDTGTDEAGNDTTMSKPFRFIKDFVLRHVLNDKRWIQDSDWTFAGMEIRGIYKDALASGARFVDLTNDQFKKLKECGDKPSGGWTIVPQVMFQITHFIDAVTEAMKEEEARPVQKPAPLLDQEPPEPLERAS
jgi:hypothetical protein